jgi:hypothetical protein
MTTDTLVPKQLWQTIQPLLPPPPRRCGGRPRIDDRAATSRRQESPVASLVMVPSGSTTKTRPAASLRYQALKALIRSNPDHGTHTDGLTRWAFMRQ